MVILKYARGGDSKNKVYFFECSLCPRYFLLSITLYIMNMSHLKRQRNSLGYSYDKRWLWSQKITFFWCWSYYTLPCKLSLWNSVLIWLGIAVYCPWNPFFKVFISLNAQPRWGYGNDQGLLCVSMALISRAVPGLIVHSSSFCDAFQNYCLQ